MTFEISKNANALIQNQTFMNNADVINLLEKNHYVDLGCDLEKENISHFLTYSRQDKKCLILVLNNKNSEVETILFYDINITGQWSINPEVISCITNEDFKLNTLNQSQIVKQAMATTNITIFDVLGDISKQNFKHRTPIKKTVETPKAKPKREIKLMGKGEFRQLVRDNIGTVHNKVSGKAYAKYKRKNQEAILKKIFKDIIYENPELKNGSKILEKPEFEKFMEGNIVKLNDKQMKILWRHYLKLIKANKEKLNEETLKQA